MNKFDLKAYDYSLPDNKIAQKSVTPKDTSKLLVYKDGTIQDHYFYEIDKFISKDSKFFFNDTSVYKARLKFDNIEIKKQNGTNGYIKQGEILFMDKIDESIYSCLVSPGKKIKKSDTFEVYGVEFEVIDYTKKGRLIKVQKDISLLDFLEKNGEMPLPPYVKYSKEKEKYYQSIFAKNTGSIAAPTASLHFTDRVLKNLKQKSIGFNYVTLHVGLGTFAKVDTKDIKKYDIHKEKVVLDLDIFDKITNFKKNNNDIVGVGTTVTRTLESLPYLYAILKDEINIENDFFERIISNGLNDKNYIHNLEVKQNKIHFETKLFIYPGFKFNIIDKLITNFHLPKSSLLMLVAAWIGYDKLWEVYDHAIENNYRFYSFGDACLLEQ